MVYLFIITMIFIIDLFLKTIVEQKYKLGVEKSVFKGKFLLQRYHNKGFALNAFEKYPKFVAFVPFIVWVIMFLSLIIILFKKGYVGIKLALSMILGGALSNIYDRFTKHYVVDYLRFGVKWKWLRKIVFNLSDLCIIFGTILLFIAPKKK